MKIENLYKASFKGAQFFLQSARTEGGRVIVYDKYPNTDNHSLQDLGKETKTFTLDGIIGGDNYIADRDALISVLDSEGVGILSHPFYGDIQARLNGKYSISETMGELGFAVFSMPFIIEPLQIFPAPSLKQNQSVVADKAITAVASAEAIVSSKFSISRNVHKNFEAAKEKLEKLADKFNEAKAKAEIIAENINDFETAVLDFRDNITALINTPAELAAEITGLFNSLNILAKDPLGQIDMFKAFFNFGGDDIAIPQTTAERIERAQSLAAINEAVLSQSLSLCYENAALADYLTTDDIDSVKTVLEAQYNYCENIVTDPDTISALADLRKEARIFFDLESLQVYRIDDISAPSMPCAPYCFSLYGNLDNWQTLLDLNKTKDPAFIGGDFKVLAK